MKKNDGEIKKVKRNLLEKVLRSDRIIFKFSDINHADELFQLIKSNQDYLKKWMPWIQKIQQRSDIVDYLKENIISWENGTSFNYNLFELTSQKLIGNMGLFKIDLEKKFAFLDFWIAEEYSGKGYISEALQFFEVQALNLGIHRLQIRCDRQNKKSIKVVQKANFKLESKIIDDLSFDGKYRDSLIFVKLLNETRENCITENLPAGFYICKTDRKTFWESVQPQLVKVFDDKELIIRALDIYDKIEKKEVKKIRSNFNYKGDVYFLIKQENELVGWTWGHQDSFDSFYMVNSAILPQFRGRGLYSNLLDVVLDYAITTGFEKIYSRHNISNNIIIMSKLRKGFNITNFEINELYGVLVHLTFLKNRKRKNLLEYRSGSLRPDLELKKILKL